jgi:putative ABC transport system ATP-binding protein
VTAPTLEPLLTCQALSLRLGTTQALDGASLEVRPGELVAVLGPSGSGKSTLLHCLSGILVPDAGEVRYRGRRLDTMSDDRRSRLRRDEFGFVFQFGQLVPELSALENVSLPLRLGGQGRRAAAAAAAAWLERLGVPELARRRPGELSGGQQQRVAVARALASGPRVVFADEPTGSLDTVNGELVMELLVQAARHQGTAVVLVTHDHRVAAYAEREVLLRDGRVEAPMAAADR